MAENYKWQTGKRRPRNPLEVQFRGRIYKGWVSDIFKAILTAEEGKLQQGWEDQVWGALKAKYPKYIQQVSTVEIPTVSVATALSFIQFVRKRGFDRSNVSVEEADRRAAICASCPKVQLVSGCPKCKAVLKQFVDPPEHQLDFGTQHGKPNEGCGACGCYLPLKAWIPRKFLDLGSWDWWEGCWMLTSE